MLAGGRFYSSTQYVSVLVDSLYTTLDIYISCSVQQHAASMMLR